MISIVKSLGAVLGASLLEITMKDPGAKEEMSNLADRYRNFGFKNSSFPKISEVGAKAFKISDRAEKLAKGEQPYRRTYSDEYKNKLANQAKSLSEKPAIDRKETLSPRMNWDRSNIKSIVRNSSKVQKDTNRRMLSSLKKSS